MPAYSQEQVPIELELDIAQTRTIDEGGMTIAFERIKAGVETAPIYKGLPDDACQSPHWGYVIEGRLRVVLNDGTEDVAAAGQAYYLPPGHNVVVEEDTLVVEFSPTEDRARTMDHAARVVQAAARA
jgi:hypothetical protein